MMRIPARFALASILGIVLCAGAVAAQAPARTEVSPGFRTARLWDDHFRKHGREFGKIDAVAYLKMAQALRDRPLTREVLEAVRADGVITRFDRTTGAFIAFNRDKTIRTFFKPNDGEAYFRRQARRSPGR